MLCGWTWFRLHKPLTHGPWRTTAGRGSATGLTVIVSSTSEGKGSCFHISISESFLAPKVAAHLFVFLRHQLNTDLGFGAWMGWQAWLWQLGSDGESSAIVVTHHELRADPGTLLSVYTTQPRSCFSWSGVAFHVVSSPSLMSTGQTAHLNKCKCGNSVCLS